MCSRSLSHLCGESASAATGQCAGSPETTECHPTPCRSLLLRAKEQPPSLSADAEALGTPPGIRVVTVAPRAALPGQDLFSASSLVRDRMASVSVGDSCGCMEYGFSRSVNLMLGVVFSDLLLQLAATPDIVQAAPALGGS